MAHPLSEPCGRKAKQNEGRPCKRLVIGGGPCFLHGGAAPQVRAAREARIAAWEAAQRSRGSTDDEPRDVSTILIDAALESDRIARALRQQLDERGVVVGATLDALADWLDRASRVAKTVVDAKVDVRRVELEAARERKSTETGMAVAGVIQRMADDLRAHLLEAGVSVPPGWDIWVNTSAAQRLRELSGDGPVPTPRPAEWTATRRSPAPRALPAGREPEDVPVEAEVVDVEEADIWPA